MKRAIVFALIVLALASVLSAQEPEVRVVLEGHKYPVFCIAFSPDGKTLASGSGDNTLRLWNTATGREIATCAGRPDAPTSIVFSPDGRTLATGNFAHAIKLWSVAAAKQTTTLNGHGDSVESIAFSPDGKLLASGSDDATIKLWDMATGKEARTLKGHASCVKSVAFTPDGKASASGSFDKTISFGMYARATTQQPSRRKPTKSSPSRLARTARHWLREMPQRPSPFGMWPTPRLLLLSADILLASFPSRFIPTARRWFRRRRTVRSSFGT